MNIQTLKLELIEWISQLDNLNTVIQLKKYQHESSEAETDINPALQRALAEGLKDIEEGRIVPHEEVMKKYAKWL